mgnify:CR=1 FL=1|jgi:hypothetical protein
MKKKLIVFFICFITYTNAQISQKWDNYYSSNPSGIENDYTASKFIEVINYVGFQSKIYKPESSFKKILLMMPYEGLRQMMITGNYYSRTIKHDDYFELYNLNYNKISKEIWNLYAPYLLPLMQIDGVVKFR